MKKSKQRRVLILDGYNTFLRSWLIVPITNMDGEHFGGVFGFLKSLKAIIEKVHPTEVVVTWDGTDSGYRRKKMYKGYKANRKKEWKPGGVKAFEFMSREEERGNFVFQVQRVQSYLGILPIKHIQLPFIEADDIIAEYVKHFTEEYTDPDIENELIIYSSDADFKQLIVNTDNTHVMCYNPISKVLLSENAWIEKYGYHPSNFILTKIFTGDNSDNIPGLKGYGEKTIIKLFPIMKTQKNLTVYDMLDYCDMILKSKPKSVSKSNIKRYDEILESKDLLILNYDLMQLKNVNISSQAREAVKNLFFETPNKFDTSKLRFMFIEDKLQGQVKSINDWVNSFSSLQVC